MSRYVDIDPIIASHTNAEYKVSDISFAEAFYAPSIDIVRCKECRWRNTKRCIIHFFKEDLKDHDYCSYGERESE